MVEVTSSSSRGATSSDSGNTGSDAFDLNSWQGLTELLKVARTAGLGEETYASFRDVVLEYAQSGGDASLKEKIDDVILTFKLPEEEPEISEEKKDRGSHEHAKSTVPKKGTSRPVPTFESSETSPPKSTKDSTVTPKEEREQLTDVPDNLPVGEQKEVPEGEVNVVVPTQKEQTKEVAPPPPLASPVEPPKEIKEAPAQQSIPDLPIVPPPAPPAPEVVGTQKQPIPQREQPKETEKIPTAKAVLEVPSTPPPSLPVEPKPKLPAQQQVPVIPKGVVSKSQEEHKVRIAEIKRLVNTKVGNPVMLIDAENSVGRDYMNALLGAMKASGGGPAGSLDTAMARLEDAYVAITEHTAGITAATSPEPQEEDTYQEPEITEQSDVTPQKTVTTEPPVHREPTPELKSVEVSEPKSVPEPYEIPKTPKPKPEPESVTHVPVESEEEDEEEIPVVVKKATPEVLAPAPVSPPVIPKIPAVQPPEEDIVTEEKPVKPKEVPVLKKPVAEEEKISITPIPPSPQRDMPQKPPPHQSGKSFIPSIADLEKPKIPIPPLEEIPEAEEESSDTHSPHKMSIIERIKEAVLSGKKKKEETTPKEKSLTIKETEPEPTKPPKHSESPRLQKPIPIPPLPKQKLKAESEKPVSKVPTKMPKVAPESLQPASATEPQKLIKTTPLPSQEKKDVSAPNTNIQPRDTIGKDTFLETKLDSSETQAKLAESVPEPQGVALGEEVDPAVEAALTQLLNEWSLFKGSGLFGMGPGGREHPLYKELEPLRMSSVMAGRWEKSTPDERQVLKDYVNAWRHEQGIAYNPSETFKQYLHRVIARIIKRQST